MFQTPVINDNSGSSDESSYGMKIFSPASTRSIDCMDKREIRFDSKCKIKTSFYSSPIEDEILHGIGLEPGVDLEKLVSELEIIDSPVNSREDPEKHVKIPELEQRRWNEIVTTFVELNNIRRPICCIPSTHELKVDPVVLNSVWQTGLPWMRLNTENMPLSALG